MNKDDTGWKRLTNLNKNPFQIESFPNFVYTL